MTVTKIYEAFFSKAQVQVSPNGLGLFRISFGILTFISTFRFWLNGWIDELYLKPAYQFKYWGFQWVVVPSSEILYAMHGLLLLASVSITLGLFYRINIILFFCVFTYIELLDVSYYLNHYYFMSCLSFLMIFLPLDKSLNYFKNNKPSTVPFYTIWALRAQVGMVYFFAGIAKLNYDWLIQGQPLKIWLTPRTDTPLIGFLFAYPEISFIMSWLGALFDLALPFLLCHKKTRLIAFVVCVLFHTITGYLFPIGMFPYIMIFAVLIFFPTHLGLKDKCDNLTVPFTPKVKAIVLWPFLFILFQSFIALRHWCYPGNHLWHERGFRFAYHVMLIEKNAYLEYIIKDKNSSKKWIEYPREHLSQTQEKAMSTQPDLILQFAHHLRDQYAAKNINVEIYAKSTASLNGRKSSPLIDEKANLATIRIHPFSETPWILPLPSDLKH